MPKDDKEMRSSMFERISAEASPMERQYEEEGWSSGLTPGRKPKILLALRRCHTGQFLSSTEQTPQLPAISLWSCAPRLGGEQLQTLAANTNFVNNKDGHPRCKYTFCRRFSSIYIKFIVFTFITRKSAGLYNAMGSYK